jgi:hypothetical protein
MFSTGDDGDEGGDEDRGQRQMPPWFGPPEDELGAVVPLGLILGRSKQGVVALSHATVYSTGLTLDFIGAARGLTNSQSSRLFHEQHLFEEDEEPPPGFLRIGIELPDGERVSNLGGRMGRRHLLKPDEEPDGPVFMQSGGGGGSAGGRRVRMSPGFWLWPRPGSGAMRVFCEWPIVEIPLSTGTIETGELVAAAELVAPIWPEPLA